MKKTDPLYANSDQDFDLFLKFLKNHEMANYASFLHNFEKDKSLLIEFEKENIDIYHKYFQPDNEAFLHLKIDLLRDDEGKRNLAYNINSAAKQLDEVLLSYVFGIFLEEYGT